ncbi:11488_t:CDS:2, partial [Funneliformis mosseae]
MHDEIGQPKMEYDGILLYQTKHSYANPNTIWPNHAYLMNKNLEFKQLSYKEFIGVAC